MQAEELLSVAENSSLPTVSITEVEAAGIEPASENVPSENLHTCQVPIWSYPGLKEPASQPGHQPIRFRPSPPGQQLGAILPEVTPSGRPTGEPAQDVAGY